MLLRIILVSLHFNVALVDLSQNFLLDNLEHFCSTKNTLNKIWWPNYKWCVCVFATTKTGEFNHLWKEKTQACVIKVMLASLPCLICLTHVQADGYWRLHCIFLLNAGIHHSLRKLQWPFSSWEMDSGPVSCTQKINQDNNLSQETSVDVNILSQELFTRVWPINLCQEPNWLTRINSPFSHYMLKNRRTLLVSMEEVGIWIAVWQRWLSTSACYLRSDIMLPDFYLVHAISHHLTDLRAIYNEQSIHLPIIKHHTFVLPLPPSTFHHPSNPLSHTKSHLFLSFLTRAQLSPYTGTTIDQCRLELQSLHGDCSTIDPQTLIITGLTRLNALPNPKH